MTDTNTQTDDTTPSSDNSTRNQSHATPEQETKYFQCPECGRVVTLLYNKPEPAAIIGCTDGHQSEDMFRIDASEMDTQDHLEDNN